MAKKVNEVNYDALELPSNTNEVDYSALEIPQGTEKKNAYSQPTNQGTTASTSKPLIFKDALEKPSEESKASAYAPRFIESKVKSKKNEAELKTEDEQSFVGELVNSLGRGSARLGEMLANTPSFIYDVAAMPQNFLAEKTGLPISATSTDFANTLGLPENKLADYYKSMVDESQNEISNKYDKSVTDYFFGENKDYEKGFKYLANQVVESAPITLSLMAGNFAGATPMASTLAGGAVFGAGKKSELDSSSPEIDESTKTFNALSTGLFEGAFEQFGISKLGGVAKDVLLKEGKDAAYDIAKKGFMETYAPVLKKYVGVGFEESLSEAATQFAENVTDKYTGAKPDLDLMEGIVDAALVGLGSSVAYSSPIATIDILSVSKEKQKAQELSLKKQQIESQLSNPETSPIVKDILKSEVDAVNNDITDLYYDAKNVYDGLNDESKSQVSKINTEISQLNSALSDETLSNENRTLILDKIAQKESELSKIVESPTIEIDQTDKRDAIDLDITPQVAPPVIEQITADSKVDESQPTVSIPPIEVKPLEVTTNEQTVEEGSKIEFSSKEIKGGIGNILDEKDAFVALKEFVSGLTQSDGGKGASKYHPTKFIINGKPLKIRVSNHSGNFDPKDSYTVSLVVDKDFNKLKVEHGDNYTEIRVPDKLRDLEGNIDDIIYEIENIPQEQFKKNEPTVKPITETEAIIDSEGVSGVSEVSKPMAEGIQPSTEGQVQEVPKVEPTPKDALSEAEQVSGDTALQIAEREDYVPSESNPNEWIEYIAAKSKNVFEIAKTYVEQLKNQLPTMSAKNQAMYDRGITFTEAELKQTGLDAKDLTPYQRLFIDNNPKQDLDQQLQGLDENLTINDYFDFIDDLGRGTAVNKEGQKLIDGLVEAYRRETGQKLTPHRAKVLLSTTAAKVAAGVEKSTIEEATLAEDTKAQRDVADAVLELRDDTGNDVLGLPNDVYNKAIEAISDKIASGKTLAEAMTDVMRDMKLNKVEGFDKSGFLSLVEDMIDERVLEMNNAGMQRLRERYGFGEREKVKGKSRDEIKAWADDLIANNRAEVERVIAGLKSGEITVTAEYQILVGKYIAALSAKVDKSPTVENLAKLKEVISLYDGVMSSTAANTLNARQGFGDIKDTLGDWVLKWNNAVANVKDGEDVGIVLTDEEIENVRKLHEEYSANEKEQLKEGQSILDAEYGNPAKQAFDRLLKENEDLKKKIEQYKKGKDKNKRERAVKQAVDKFKDKWKTKKNKLTFKDKDGNEIFVDDPVANGLTKDLFIDLVSNAAIGVAKMVDRVEAVIEQVKDSDWYNKLDGGERESFKKMVENAIKETIEADYSEMIEKAKGLLTAGLNIDSANSVRAMVRELVKQGETSLEAISDKISKDLGGVIDTKTIENIVGGLFSDKATKSDLAEKMRRLKGYAVLVRKYNALLNGETIDEAFKKSKPQERAEISLMKQKIEALELQLGIKAEPLTDAEKEVNRSIKSLEKAAQIAKDKLDAINKGTYTKPDGKKQTVDTKEQADAKQKLKEANDALAKAKKDSGITDAENLDRRAKNAEKAAEHYRDRINKGDFSQKPRHDILSNPIIAKKHPEKLAKYREAMRKKRDAKHEFDVAVTKKILENRYPKAGESVKTKAGKIASLGVDFFKKAVNTFTKTAATFDDSAMGVHGLLVLYRSPKIWVKTLKEGLMDAYTKQTYRESLERLQEDEDAWERYKFTKLDIFDMDDLSESEREAMTLETWWDTPTTYKGKTMTLGERVKMAYFDRLFVASGNSMRAMMFDERVEPLLREGKTIYTHPQEFKDVAKVVNNMTGRGGMKGSDLGILNLFMWAPNLLKSAYNMVGLSDITNAVPFIKSFNPDNNIKKEDLGYYASLTPTAQKQAFMDLLYVGLTIGGLMMMSKAAGADVDDDPESPLYGKVIFPNGWSWDVGGRLMGIIRLVIQLANTGKGAPKQEEAARSFAEYEQKRIEKENKKRERTASEVVARFLRGKASILTGTAIDYQTGEDYFGRSIYNPDGTIRKEWILSKPIPMGLRNIYESAQIRGIDVSKQSVPLFVGFPLNDNLVYEANKKEIEDARSFAKKEKQKVDDAEKAYKKIYEKIHRTEKKKRKYSLD